MPSSPRRRRSNRLAGYDYGRPGAYFVTICAHGFRQLFGKVSGDDVRLSPYGEIVRDCWMAIPEYYASARLDEFVVMPNHVHGILWLTATGASTRASVCPAGRLHSPLQGDGGDDAGVHGPELGTVIGAFKAVVTSEYRRRTDETESSVWQRNYYDHIVRSEKALYLIRRYIRENPRRWTLDRYHANPAGVDDHAVEIWNRLRSDDEADMESLHYIG